MNVIYMSENYYIVEHQAGSFVHGYEIVDKVAQRFAFISGAVADKFADELTAVTVKEPSTDNVDEFLNTVEMQQILLIH